MTIKKNKAKGRFKLKTIRTSATAERYSARCLPLELSGKIPSALIKFRSLAPCKSPTLPIRRRAINHCISPLTREEIKKSPNETEILKKIDLLKNFKI